MAFALVPIVVRWLSRRALRWHYRELHFVGSERIPVSGAVMLFGNHPNDLPDVLAGFFTTSRQVRYVATISAAVTPMARVTYKGLGVIPVTRVRDARKMRARGVDVASVNAAAFGEVQRAFEAGHVVGVFPQGGVHDVCKIGKPRAGVSKMALDSINNGAISDIQLVAFGVQYEAASRLRSDMVVLVGEPFSLAHWCTEFIEAGSIAQPAMLTDRLHKSMLAVTRNSESWGDAEARDRLVAAVAAVQQIPQASLLALTAMVQRACSEFVAADVGAEPNRESVPESGTEPEISATAPTIPWRTIAHPLSDWVERAGGCGTSARDTARVMDAAGWPNMHAEWPSMAWMILTAIPAWVGLILHYPLFWLVRRMAQQYSIGRSDLAARAIIPGLHLILLGYLTLGGVFALSFRAAAVSGWWAIPAVMLLPRLGDVGLAWHDAYAALTLRARVRRWPNADRAAICAAAERVRNAWAAVFSS